MCFGLSLLSSKEFANDWFTNDSMSIKPINDKIEEFVDYTYYLGNWIKILKKTAHFYKQCGQNIRVILQKI